MSHTVRINIVPRQKSNKIKFNIKLNPGDKEKLQDIAFSLGLARITGIKIGEMGSITRLLQAIISGEVKLSKDDTSIPQRLSMEERFWSKVDKNGPIIIDTPCWIWTGFTHPFPRNYGMFTIRKGYSIRTHRLSWELTSGMPIPKGMLVCHKCDNPPCCNPDHLFLGTSKDNSMDMSIKKRAAAPRGEKSPRAKLTWDKVDEIRYKYANTKITQRALALEYGVHQAIISAILKEKTWKIEWEPK